MKSKQLAREAQPAHFKSRVTTHRISGARSWGNFTMERKGNVENSSDDKWIFADTQMTRILCSTYILLLLTDPPFTLHYKFTTFQVSSSMVYVYESKLLGWGCTMHNSKITGRKMATSLSCNKST